MAAGPFQTKKNRFFSDEFCKGYYLLPFPIAKCNLFAINSRIVYYDVDLYNIGFVRVISM